MSVCRALLSVYRALLSVCRALLSVYTALLSVCRALLSVGRALLSVCRALPKMLAFFAYNISMHTSMQIWELSRSYE